MSTTEENTTIFANPTLEIHNQHTVLENNVGRTLQWCTHPDTPKLLDQHWKHDVIVSENETIMYTNYGKRFEKTTLKQSGVGHQARFGQEKYDMWLYPYKLAHIKSASLNTLADIGVVCTGYTDKYGKDQCKLVVDLLKDLGYEFEYADVLG